MSEDMLSIASEKTFEEGFAGYIYMSGYEGF